MRPSLVIAAATLAAVPASAQTGGFVATLGKDTLHVERFTKSPGKIEGTIVTRSPITRIARWQLLLDANGRPTRYEVRTSRADGTPDRTPGSNGVITLTGDTLIRETPGAEKPDSQRVPAPTQVVPGPSIPYVGVSYLMYEVAFAEARTRAQNGETTIRQVTMNPRINQAYPTRVWFVGGDSVELDYFGVTKSGYKFDRGGNLTHADWSLTTYRYQINRVADVNVERIAEGWLNAEKAGAAMGALSPRDTARGSVGVVTVMVDYSRPSKRGRKIWGEVVPWDKVWRLGADFATHVVFSGDVRVGDADIPAGTYTLWMLPSENGEAKLVINKAVRIFGTNYRPADDLVRIPLRRDGKAVAERLTIGVSDGRLRIHWDDAEYSVAIVPR
jgi:hypothetical protein